MIIRKQWVLLFLLILSGCRDNGQITFENKLNRYHNDDYSIFEGYSLTYDNINGSIFDKNILNMYRNIFDEFEKLIRPTGLSPMEADEWINKSRSLKSHIYNKSLGNYGDRLIAALDRGIELHQKRIDLFRQEMDNRDYVENYMIDSDARRYNNYVNMKKIFNDINNQGKDEYLRFIAAQKASREVMATSWSYKARMELRDYITKIEVPISTNSIDGTIYSTKVSNCNGENTYYNKVKNACYQYGARIWNSINYKSELTDEQYNQLLKIISDNTKEVHEFFVNRDKVNKEFLEAKEANHRVSTITSNKYGYSYGEALKNFNNAKDNLNYTFGKYIDIETMRFYLPESTGDFKKGQYDFLFRKEFERNNLDATSIKEIFISEIKKADTYKHFDKSIKIVLANSKKFKVSKKGTFKVENPDVILIKRASNIQTRLHTREITYLSAFDSAINRDLIFDEKNGLLMMGNPTDGLFNSRMMIKNPHYFL